MVTPREISATPRSARQSRTERSTALRRNRHCAAGRGWHGSGGSDTAAEPDADRSFRRGQASSAGRPGHPARCPQVVPETDAYCCSISVIGRPAVQPAAPQGGRSRRQFRQSPEFRDVMWFSEYPRPLPPGLRAARPGDAHPRVLAAPGGGTRARRGDRPQGAGLREAVWLTADGSHSTQPPDGGNA